MVYNVSIDEMEWKIKFLIIGLSCFHLTDPCYFQELQIKHHPRNSSHDIYNSVIIAIKIIIIEMTISNTLCLCISIVWKMWYITTPPNIGWQSFDCFTSGRHLHEQLVFWHWGCQWLVHLDPYCYTLKLFPCFASFKASIQ